MELVKISKILEKIATVCKRHDIPTIGVNTGEILSLLAALYQPRKILEIGTGGGYSTIWIASRLKHKYSIETIEKDRNVCSIAEKSIKSTPFSRNINVIHSNALTWLKRKRGTEYDYIFVDGKKSEYHQYLQFCGPLLRKKGLIIFDDTLFWMKGNEDKAGEFKTKKERVLHGLMMKKLKIYFKDFNSTFQANPQFNVIFMPIENGLTIGQKQ